MAFRKKYTKRVYKGSKALKKSNIFKNKSSEAQANQIYKLNKKVNYIQKTTAPEITRYQDNIFNVHFKTDDEQAITHKNGVIPLFKDNILKEDNPKHISICGDFIRMRYLQLYGVFDATSYSDVMTDMLAGRSAPEEINRTLSVPWTAYLRIIVCKLKRSVQAVPQKITQDPDQTYEDTDHQYDIKPIIGPLINNLSSQLTVLKDKVIKIDNTKPSKMYKIKLSPKQLGYVYRKAPDGLQNTVGQNELIIYYQYVCPALLRWVSSTYQLDKKLSPISRFTMNVNFGYVDQN